MFAPQDDGSAAPAAQSAASGEGGKVKRAAAKAEKAAQKAAQKAEAGAEARRVAELQLLMMNDDALRRPGSVAVSAPGKSSVWPFFQGFGEHS